MQVLKAELVQGLGAEHLRVTQLEGVLVAVRVEALRGEVELPDSAVGEIVVEKLIANRETLLAVN